MDAELSEKLEQLRELKQLVEGAITYIESELPGIPVKPPLANGGYDFILGEKFGVTNLRSLKDGQQFQVPSPHANLGAHQAEVERQMAKRRVLSNVEDSLTSNDPT
jgi:hypothetical protein